LPTYSGGDGPRKAGDDEAARAIFNGGGGIVRRCSGLRNSSGSDGDGRGSSSKQRFSAGRFDSTDLQSRAWGSMVARWWKARAPGALLFIGEKRGRITYTPGSLSLTDSVEFELDFSFG
jgi:hypothetical protein